MKNKIIITTCLIIATSLLAFGQADEEKLIKNTIGVYWVPSMTHTNLNRSKVDKISQVQRLAEFEDQTVPVFGYSVGLQYRRVLSEKVMLGFGIGYAEKGEKSIPIKMSNPLVPDNGFGYTYYYDFTLESFQIPFELEFVVNEFKLFKKRTQIIYGGRLTFDIHGGFIGRDYWSFASEPLNEGSPEYLFYHPSRLVLKNLFGHLFAGYFRLAIGVNCGIQYELSERVFAQFKLDYNHYSQIINTNDYILPGNAWILGININTSMRF